MRRSWPKQIWRRLARTADGAVAPTVALSLFVLVGTGGLAFDYARLASMDTELQNAADQAALAAATQLDGSANSINRATAAAQGLLRNTTLFGNAVGTIDPTKVAIGTVTFYESYDNTTDTYGPVATTDATAKVVRVYVGGRRADYAFTPIVGALNSGSIVAEAVATLGAGAICKVPPVMLCNPNEPSGGSFPTAGDIGKGLRLVPGAGTGSWAPGNYGYLDFGGGASDLEAAMGSNLNSEPCVDASTVNTKPGNQAGVPAGINTRFDMYQNGLVAYCDPDATPDKCSPSPVTIKDVVHFPEGNPWPSNANCGFQTGQNPWRLPAKEYLPDATTRAQDTAVGTPTNMGLPRDICHSVSMDGDCVQGSNTQSKFGNGNWDRNLYFQINHTVGQLATAATFAGKNSTATTGPTALTRYDVYKWELSKLAANTLTLTRDIGLMKKTNPQGDEVGQPVAHFSYATPQCPGAVALASSSTQKDRRLLTAAVVNCTAGNVHGSTHIAPAGWVDLFITEPSLDRTRTSKDQIYVEVVGVSTRPNGQSAFQYYLRQKPRLVR